MKKQWSKLSILIGYAFLSFSGQAQNEIQSYNQLTEIASKMLIGTDEVAKDQAAAVQLLNISADNNDPHAQYLLGFAYKRGMGVAVNDTKAFEYTEKAALQDHPNAACELGMLYQEGVGCKLNFDTATSWFLKAQNLGNDRGGYLIGYQHFKGLGSIEQDYSKAIEWFSNSAYPMANHWLAICNYFGYGMPVNKEKALEILLANTYAVNSEILVEHLDQHPNLLDVGIQKENTLKATEFSTTKINEMLSVTAEQEAIEVNKTTLPGEWKGKLIELDWSGKKINRSFPIALDFSINKDTQDLNFKANINNKTSDSYGIFLDDSFYFTDFNMELPRLYQDDRRKFHLDYRVLSANSIEIKEINNIHYLVANIDTKVLDWSEPGPPMLVVLSNTKALTDNGKEIDQALIEALTQLQDDSFITLYPNPFKTDLLVQYELAEDSNTSVEIYTLDGTFKQTIVTNKSQKEGKHLYHVDGANYPQKGFYVVRVTANKVTHTKLIIKE